MMQLIIMFFNYVSGNAFTFEQSTYAVMEGSTHLNLTIARTGEAAIPIELVLSTPDDSKDSSNYISSFKNTVVFQPSQQSVAVVIPIVDDSVKENTIDEFLLTLSPGPGTQSFRDRLSLGSSGTASAVVKVQDNDIGMDVAEVVITHAHNLLYNIYADIKVYINYRIRQCSVMIEGC